jgi:hypothetical protein
VEDFILDGFDGGREVGNEVVRIGIKADHDGISEEPGDFVVGPEGVKDFAINLREQILVKAADGFSRAQNGSPNAFGIEFDERAAPLLDFNNAILDGHAG